VGTTFFVTLQTGPGAHLDSYAMDTGLFPEDGIDYPPPSSAEVKERI